MEIDDLLNPDATLGHNKPPLVDQLRDQYAGRIAEVEGLTERARKLLKVDEANEPIVGKDGRPVSPITKDEDLAPVAGIVIEARRLAKRLEEDRKAENEPHRIAVKAINDFFGVMDERLKGLQATFNGWVTTYNEAKEALERRRLAEVARLADEEARRRRLEAEATRHSVEAEVVMREADIAQHRADHAAAQATSSSSELTRTRTGGATVTSVGTWTFAIDDFAAIPLEKLRPFFGVADIEKALRGYTKANQDKAPLPGVRFFKTHQASIRG